MKKKDLKVPVTRNYESMTEGGADIMAQEKLTLKERIKDWSVGSALVDGLTFAGEVVAADMFAAGFQYTADTIADTYDFYNHEQEYVVKEGVMGFGRKTVVMTPAQYRKTYGSN